MTGWIAAAISLEDALKRRQQTATISHWSKSPHCSSPNNTNQLTRNGDRIVTTGFSQIWSYVLAHYFSGN